MPNVTYKVQGTTGPEKNDNFSLKKISSKLGVMHDITPNSLCSKPFAIYDEKTWLFFLYSILSKSF
jgi:hypothetical protein